MNTVVAFRAFILFSFLGKFTAMRDSALELTNYCGEMTFSAQKCQAYF